MQITETVPPEALFPRLRLFQLGVRHRCRVGSRDRRAPDPGAQAWAQVSGDGGCVQRRLSVAALPQCRRAGARHRARGQHRAGGRGQRHPDPLRVLRQDTRSNWPREGARATCSTPTTCWRMSPISTASSKASRMVLKRRRRRGHRGALSAGSDRGRSSSTRSITSIFATSR